MTCQQLLEDSLKVRTARWIQTSAAKQWAVLRHGKPVNGLRQASWTPVKLNSVTSSNFSVTFWPFGICIKKLYQLVVILPPIYEKGVTFT